MRWIWTLAIACVIAATGVRPQLEVRQDVQSDQIERATPGTLQHLSSRSATLQQLATRPQGLRAPSLHSPPLAIIPASGFSTTPPRARAFATAWPLHASFSQHVPTSPARGPPVG
jgi:hypothetical protein